MNVTPKQRVKIDIKAGAEQYKVYVTGTMAPGLQNEVVRVDVTDPFGYRRCVNSTTSTGGSFSAHIDVSKPPVSIELLPVGHPNSFPVLGVYLVQARTINSPNAAQAESNSMALNIS